MVKVSGCVPPSPGKNMDDRGRKNSSVTKVEYDIKNPDQKFQTNN